MPKKAELMERRFGKLIVIKELPVSSRGQSMWECLCDCGSVTSRSGSSLIRKSKPTRSCGCVLKNLYKGDMTQERLKEIVMYNPDNGDFIWTDKSSCRVTSGDAVGGIDAKGYCIATIDAKNFKIHRLIFLYMTGSFPESQVDHINHNRSDNRWINLRSVTNGDNSRNKSLAVNNTSGVIGVSWNSSARKWKACIQVEGQKINLGSYSNKVDAVDARKGAEIKYNFHKNHGAKV